MLSFSERKLTEEQQKDFYQAIRIAVDRMTDEISSLLGFSKQCELLGSAYGRVEGVIVQSIKTVKILPEI